MFCDKGCRRFGSYFLSPGLLAYGSFFKKGAVFGQKRGDFGQKRAKILVFWARKKRGFLRKASLNRKKGAEILGKKDPPPPSKKGEIGTETL